MERQVFVDMDGVLADFDAHHEAVFGVRSCKEADNVDWDAVRAVPGFYADIPPMADMKELWAAVQAFRPIILTGVPHSVPEAPFNKRSWVAKHIGHQTEVRCCRSSEKCRHARPGDTLIETGSSTDIFGRASAASSLSTPRQQIRSLSYGGRSQSPPMADPDPVITNVGLGNAAEVGPLGMSGNVRGSSRFWRDVGAPRCSNGRIVHG